MTANRIYNAILVGTLFAVMAYLVPTLINRYTPTSHVYEWQHFEMKPVFKTCEPIFWKFERRSKISAQAVVSERIIDGVPVMDRSYSGLVIANDEWKHIPVIWDAGCLPQDKYRLEIVVNIPYGEAIKTHAFYQDFVVEE